MKPAAIAFLGLLAACQQTQDHTQPGKALFETRCASCHGHRAQGHGPLAAELPVAPADLTRLAERNGGTFPHEAVMTQIYGYPGRHHLGLMPEFGPELSGATVEWTAADGTTIATPAPLIAVVDYLVSIQQ
ncbi:c-type cytochrome [Tropicibacter sp. S64]|uniref:c-type cytochrome n=1 Tax=Tropicibacter sp. S64 TaxID=3415122 RepID=UPI003C7B2E87